MGERGWTDGRRGQAEGALFRHPFFAESPNLTPRRLLHAHIHTSGLFGWLADYLKPVSHRLHRPLPPLSLSPALERSRTLVARLNGLELILRSPGLCNCLRAGRALEFARVVAVATAHTLRLTHMARAPAQEQANQPQMGSVGGQGGGQLIEARAPSSSKGSP